MRFLFQLCKNIIFDCTQKVSKTRTKDDLRINLALRTVLVVKRLPTIPEVYLLFLCYKVFIRNNTENKSLSIMSAVYFDTFLVLILLC